MRSLYSRSHLTPTPFREKAGGEGEVEVGEEEAFLAVGLVALEGAVGADDGRVGPRSWGWRS